MGGFFGGGGASGNVALPIDEFIPSEAKVQSGRFNYYGLGTIGNKTHAAGYILWTATYVPETKNYTTAYIWVTGAAASSEVKLGFYEISSGGLPSNKLLETSGIATTSTGVNVNLYSNDNALLVDALKTGSSVLGYDGLSSYVQVKPAIGSSVTIGSLPAISGTVTANVIGIIEDESMSEVLSKGIGLAYTATITDNALPHVVSESKPLPVKLWNSTVTAAAPNGSLTTRFGTPTTANTAFATSAVTNASRKYLLIQNVTTGSNMITVGIGFTPTTTQGIQLTAGAGITFESSYIPTGAVYVLSSVTASNFTILEA